MEKQPPVQVVYGSPGAAAASFQCVRMSALPVDDIAARLRTAIEGAGLWVLHEIDPQALLDRGGYAIAPARQLLFFHPALMARLLAADPNALLEAPLKFAMLELPSGGSSVRWADPASAFARYDNAALADLGRELAGICHHIVTSALDRMDPPLPSLDRDEIRRVDRLALRKSDHV